MECRQGMTGSVGEERIRLGQNCEQCQEEDLIEAIHDLAILARVRQIIEIVEKYDSRRKRTAVCRRAI